MRPVLIMMVLLLAGCDPHELLADDLLWVFSQRDSYQLPDDDAAPDREIFSVTTRDGVRLSGLWLPAAEGQGPYRPAILYCQSTLGKPVSLDHAGAWASQPVGELTNLMRALAPMWRFTGR